MSKRKPAAYIMMEFMDVFYKMLVYIQPESGVSDYLRTEMIVTMNRLREEMLPHVKAAELLAGTDLRANERNKSDEH